MVYVKFRQRVAVLTADMFLEVVFTSFLFLFSHIVCRFCGAVQLFCRVLLALYALGQLAVRAY